MRKLIIGLAKIETVITFLTLPHGLDRDHDLYHYFHQDLYLDFYRYLYLDIDLAPDQDLYSYLDDYQDLAPKPPPLSRPPRILLQPLPLL